MHQQFRLIEQCSLLLPSAIRELVSDRGRLPVLPDFQAPSSTANYALVLASLERKYRRYLQNMGLRL